MIIGIASKLTKLEWDMYRLDRSSDEVIDMYKKSGRDIERIVDSHHRQKDNIDYMLSRIHVVKEIDILKIKSGEIIKPDLDLVISMGGDNFFQILAHEFPDAYHLGCNSDPETSTGVLLNYDVDRLKNKINDIASDKFEYNEWTRIGTRLNGNRLDDVLCTASLTIKATDMVSRYRLDYKNYSEEQKSTGILFATGAGSGDNAWYRNAGLYLSMLNRDRRDLNNDVYEKTKEFSRISKEFRTLTREPMGGENTKYRMLNLLIKENKEVNEDSLRLTYYSADDSELSLDSVKRYDVKEGDVLDFFVSDKGLKVVR